MQNRFSGMVAGLVAATTLLRSHVMMVHHLNVVPSGYNYILCSTFKCVLLFGCRCYQSADVVLCMFFGCVLCSLSHNGCFALSHTEE